MQFCLEGSLDARVNAEPSSSVQGGEYTKESSAFAAIEPEASLFPPATAGGGPPKDTALGTGMAAVSTEHSFGYATHGTRSSTGAALSIATPVVFGSSGDTSPQCW